MINKTNNKIKISYELLSLISMVQNYEQFIISQAIFNGTNAIINRREETLKFLDTIDKEILAKYNLDVDNDSVDKISRYDLTKIMRSENKDFEKFEF